MVRAAQHRSGPDIGVRFQQLLPRIDRSLFQVSTLSLGVGHDSNHCSVSKMRLAWNIRSRRNTHSAG